MQNQTSRDPLSVTCPCGASGRAFSLCRQCGEFLSMTIARAWYVEKMVSGPKAGKWALINPQGVVKDYYPTKQAAQLDAMQLNAAA